MANTNINTINTINTVNMEAALNELPGSFLLSSGVEIIQTSGHGCRFSDGTVFSPSPEEEQKIKDAWGFLQVSRQFKKVETDLPGIGLSSSSQFIKDEVLAKLDEMIAAHPRAIILVSFMVVAAMKEMGIRDRYPHVLACNATPDTSRAKPDEKVWDVQNFAW